MIWPGAHPICPLAVRAARIGLRVAALEWGVAFERITVNPTVAGGKPCIRGLRFPVSRLLGLLSAGETRESILTAYPFLDDADIDESLRYAADLADDVTVELIR